MSNARIKVAILYGGRTGEHEVSLRSAESILAAMDPERYDVQRILIPFDAKQTGDRIVRSQKHGAQVRNRGS